MSKLTELQNQYNAYIAAKKAVEMSKPKECIVKYGTDGSQLIKVSLDTNKLCIYNHDGNCVTILLSQVPDFVKALTDLCDDGK